MSIDAYFCIFRFMELQRYNYLMFRYCLLKIVSFEVSPVSIRSKYQSVCANIVMKYNDTLIRIFFAGIYISEEFFLLGYDDYQIVLVTNINIFQIPKHLIGCTRHGLILLIMKIIMFIKVEIECGLVT